MNTRHIISLLFLICFTSFGFAAEVSPETEATKQVAEVKSNVKDEALRFILSKAQKYSEKVENTASAMIDAAQKEAPETIKQFLVWRAVKHGLSFFMPFFILTSAFITFLVSAKKANWQSNVFSMPHLVSVVSGIIMLFSTIGVAVNFTNLLSFIQVLVAPRIYLIEQVSALIR